MTPIFAEAQVATLQGSRQLAELCQTLNKRAATKPQGAVKVAWTETDGTIDFGWATCTMHATPTVLALRAEAEDEAALDQACELITRHLQRHPGDDELTIAWQRDGHPIAHDDSDRRDLMRAFHRRMRGH